MTNKPEARPITPNKSKGLVHAMVSANKRVSFIQSLLADPEKKKKLMVDSIIATQAREGIKTTLRGLRLFAQKHNQDLTVHALNRVLSHLSESNYPALAAKEMEMAQYHGRAAARVIVKRLLREAEWSARMVGGLSWQIAKDA